MNIETIYNYHYEDLRSYLSAREKDLVLVDDLVQDAFLKLHVSIQKGKSLDSPLAWLKTVLHNLWIDHHRKVKNTILPDSEHLESTDTVKAHGPEDCLLGIIASLPYKYKKAVYMVDVKGIRQIDAAKDLRLSLPTFKSHVQRGRKLVAQGYVDCCDYKIDNDGKLQGAVKDWSGCKVCSSGV